MPHARSLSRSGTASIRRAPPGIERQVQAAGPDGSGAEVAVAVAEPTSRVGQPSTAALVNGGAGSRAGSPLRSAR